MPIVAGAIIAVAAPIVTGIIANEASADERKKTNNLLSEAEGAYKPLPADYADLIALNNYTTAPTYTPAQLQQLQLGKSPYESISQKGPGYNAQLEALAQLRQQGRTGLAATDQAALNQIRQQTLADQAGRQQALRQQFAQQGLGGSGAQLAQQLSAQQGGANVESNANLAQAAQAQNSRMAAIANMGSLGGQLSGQQLAFQGTKAGGQQANQLAQFNANLGIQQGNVGSQNQAGMYNIGNLLNQSNMNTAAKNAELEAQKNRELGITQTSLSQAGLLSGLAGTHGNLADSISKGWGQMGAGVGQAGTALAASGSKAKTPNTFNPPEGA